VPPELSGVRPFVFMPAGRRSGLARLGDWMAAHRNAIVVLQWVIVTLYAVLVVLPALLPHPNPEARLFSSDFGAASLVAPACCTTPGGAALQEKMPAAAAWYERLVLLAQYLFWGIWWPFVILSMMLVGRVWCGVLCPEGALAEFASRHGRGGAIPRWMRWAGWPFLAFVLTTVYGQLISVYEYPQAALLILGGSTVAAVGVGYLYGRGKRVWCRYLCPVSGVFALLARLAPIHFKVDRDTWNTHPQRIHAVDCPPLLNVKRLDGMAQCHACGRCSGHRDAVALAMRSPSAEIVGGDAPKPWEAPLLLFGMLGVATGAFQWTVSPWFVRLKQATAGWLIDHDADWLFGDSPAWWLLTRYPAENDVFTWLDGAVILVWIFGVAMLLGGTAWLAMRAAARVAGADWRRLALGLTPLAGLGLFLGLSMMTATHLRAEGVALGWLANLRIALLAIAVLWSAWLGLRLSGDGRGPASRRGLAFAVWLLPVTLVTANWWLIFFVW
jgi:polyferredoxin